MDIFADSQFWALKLFAGILGIAAGILVIEHPLWSTALAGNTLIIWLGLGGLFFGTITLFQAINEMRSINSRMRQISFHIRVISILFFSILFGPSLLLAGCSQADPTSTPEPATAVPTQAPTQAPTLTPAMSGTVVDLASVSIDVQGLPYSWQANQVPGTPYDNSQPPGPMGLPQHAQINFGVADPKDKQPGDPVLYIIPVEAYKRLWEGAGDTALTQTMDQLRSLLAERPASLPTSGMPVLPFEELGGFNDLAVQGKYLDTGTINGVRFVGRFGQGPDPLINEGLRYIFQGFSSDGGQFIAFFYPVTTDKLPMSASDVPDEELAQVNSDPEAYLKEKAEMLNGLTDIDWDPNLTTLDEVLTSLYFATSSADGTQ